MTVFQECQRAARRLLRRPLSAVGIVITLTLGIGISVGMFSVLDGVVLRALPYPGADRIVTIHSENLEEGVERSELTPAEAVEGLTDVPGFERTAYYMWDVFAFIGGDAPRNVTGLVVSGDYFSVLGMQAALGRTLTEADVAENRPVVVLSHAAWLALTGGDPQAIGRPLAFD